MNRSLLATAICASLLVAGTAYAYDSGAPQDQAAPPQQDQSQPNKSAADQTDKDKKKEKVQTLEAVTVTGSLLKGVEFQGDTPVQVIPIKERLAAGVTTVSGLVQNTAAAGGSPQAHGQFGIGLTGVAGGLGMNPVSLRGLGANRSLVLLDDQRAGPAGVGAGVNDFDLNVLPLAIVQRIDVVNDGASSIYGSDAIAGVINVITKKRLDHATFDLFTSVPQHGGGEEYSASFANGWNFKNGNVTMAVQVDQQQPILVGQRGFLNCTRALVWGPDGKRADLPDHSINQGTPMEGCQNMFVNAMVAGNYTVAPGGLPLEAFFPPHGGLLLPTRDGSTGQYSPVQGYALADCPTYADTPDAHCNQVMDFPGWNRAYATVKNRNETLWLEPSFTFQTPIGPIQWDTQILFNRRVTRSFIWQQFFPAVIDVNGHSEPAVGFGVTDPQVYLPVTAFPTPRMVRNNYGYMHTQLSGGFGDSSWSWTLNANATQSDGLSNSQNISVERSGDYANGGPGNQVTGPTLVNYLTPGYLNGSDESELVAALAQPFIDKTIYKQQDASILFQGDIPTPSWAAGPIGAAIGAEARHFSIHDTPGVAIWGLSPAPGPTDGADNVKEIFGQVGIPIVKDIPGVKSLVATLSARDFRYNSTGSWSHVWKYGINWEVTPSLRIRGTMGTSYRAPALFERFMAPAMGAVSQLIDPCVNWGSSSATDLTRAHCAAAGIPPDYAGSGVTANVFTKGGGDALLPETSRAKSLGIVWSPAFANLNFAIDYFDYHIYNEVTQIGALGILQGCYSMPVYPNQFCTLFTRNPPVPGQPNAFEANNIVSINNDFLNLNQERVRGYQFDWNYQHDFGFGHLSFSGSATRAISHTKQIFSSTAASGLTSNEYAGTIGNPRWYGITNVALTRGDWTYNWQGTYVNSTSDARFVSPTQTYLGLANSRIKVTAGSQLQQAVSATWTHGTLSIMLGVRNLTDKTPPQISQADTQQTLLGNTSEQASQYDWYGRTWFARMSLQL